MNFYSCYRIWFDKINLKLNKVFLIFWHYFIYLRDPDPHSPCESSGSRRSPISNGYKKLPYLILCLGFCGWPGCGPHHPGWFHRTHSPASCCPAWRPPPGRSRCWGSRSPPPGTSAGVGSSRRRRCPYSQHRLQTCTLNKVCTRHAYRQMITLISNNKIEFSPREALLEIISTVCEYIVYRYIITLSCCWCYW